MKRNFIKKLLIGGLITTICLSICFINVKASEIDDLASYYSPMEYFNQSEYVEDLEDLKGTIWHFNVDLYKIFENWGDATISLGFLQNEDENSIFDLPFFLQLRSSWVFNEFAYPIYDDPNITINVAPLCNNSSGDNAIIINVDQGGGKVYLNHYPYTLKYLSDGSQLTNKVDKVFNDKGIIQTSCLKSSGNNYTSTYLDIGFTSQQNINNFYVGSSELYLFFPNTDYIMEDYNSTNNNDYSFFNLLLKSSTRVVFADELFKEIENSYDNGFDSGYDTGYDVGYQDGYDEAELNIENDSYRFTFLTGIFNGVSDLLAIEIFPNIQLGYFVFVPLALGITGMIFWFWRKD